MFQQIVVNNMALVVQYAVGAFVPLLMVPYIVRTIGVANYGELAIALAWGGIAGAVVQYAFQLTGPKRVAQLSDPATSGGVLVEVSAAKLLLLSMVLPCVVVASYIVFGGAVGAGPLVVLLALPLAAAMNASWYLQALDKYWCIGLIAICGSALALFLGFSVDADASYHAMVTAGAALVAGPVVVGVGTLAVSWALKPRLTKSWSSIDLRAVLSEGWPLFASQFAATIYSLSGPIVLGAIAGTQEAGMYSTIERSVNALVGAGLLTHVAAYPRLARLFVTDRKAYSRLLIVVVSVYLVVMMTVACLAWIFRDAGSAFLLGPSTATPSALILWALIWLVLGIVGTVLTAYWTVSGQVARVLPLTARVLALSLLLGVPGATLYGSAGWMGALVFSQSLVLFEAYRSWRRVDAA